MFPFLPGRWCRQGRGEKEREGEKKRNIPSHPAIKFTNFHPSSILSLLSFTLSLSLFRFFWKMCVEFGKTRGREGGGRWEGDSQGIASSQPILPLSYISSFPFLPLPPSPWPFCPREEPLEAQCAPTPTVSLSLGPRHLLVGQKNNSSPSSLVSSLVPSFPQCAGRRKSEVDKDTIEKGNERERVGKGR